MMRLAIAAVLSSIVWTSACSSPCNKGNVETADKWCVIPITCPEGSLPSLHHERCELPDGGIVSPEPHAGAGASAGTPGTATNGIGRAGSSGSRSPGAGSSGTGGAAGVAGRGGKQASVDDADAGMSSNSMEPDTGPVPACGNGMKETGETCDGDDCPKSCASQSACVPAELTGSADACDLECVPHKVTECRSGDGCCPDTCTRAIDTDCSITCGDGIVDSGEKCEPKSTEHPCPTAADCDDHEVCTDDMLLGSAEKCSAECVHPPITPTMISCADNDPCTDDTPVMSTTSCSYECPHTRKQPTAANCADSDPCTDDTPVMSTTSCSYECPHTRIQGDGCCTTVADCPAPGPQCGNGCGGTVTESSCDAGRCTATSKSDPGPCKGKLFDSCENYADIRCDGSAAQSLRCPDVCFSDADCDREYGCLVENGLCFRKCQISAQCGAEETCIMTSSRQDKLCLPGL